MSDKTDLTQKLARIKAECRRAIELGEKATAGPWMAKTNHAPFKVVWISRRESYSTLELKAEDADSIAHARTFSPAAARALLTAIEGFEAAAESGKGERWIHGRPSPTMIAESTLQSIADHWPEI